MPCGPLIDSYDETHQDDEVKFNGNTTRVGQCFTTPFGQRYKPCSVKFYLKKKGQPTGWLWAYLYDVTAGRCGVDCVPDESKLICGTLSIDVASLTTSFVLYEFTFKGCDCLQSDHCYAVALIAFGSFDDNNHVSVGIDTSVPTHSGNFIAYTVTWGRWKPANDVDTIFYIYGIPCGSADEGGDAPPTTPSTEQAKIIGPRKTIWYNTEHLVLHVYSSLGKNIVLPCWMRSFIGRLAQPIVVVVKAGLGIPSFFETVVKAGIKRSYEETLHLQGKLGIKYAETLVMREDVREYILTQKAMMKNFQESLINFIETLSKKQYETDKDMENHKKKQKKKDRLRELINHVRDV